MSRPTLLLLMLLTLLCACSGTDDKKNGPKGRSTSRPYEVLVVCNKDWLKSGNGQAFRDITESEMPGLPRIETNFRLTCVDPMSFKGSFLYYANVIKADIDRKYPKAEVQIARDVYCKPQLVINVVAPTQAEFDELCAAQRESIISLINDGERTRATELLQRKYSGIAQRQAKAQFGCDIHAPEEINAVKIGEDFFWASSEASHDNYLNICMYAYPYTSTETFTEDYFIAKRDSFVRHNIIGEEYEGVVPYMYTDERTVTSRHTTLNGHYAFEVRGLWAMKHEAMGGPFVSYSMVDTVHQRVIVAEGFVFAPNKNKREFVHQLDAALQTLRLP